MEKYIANHWSVPKILEGDIHLGELQEEEWCLDFGLDAQDGKVVFCLVGTETN